MTRPVANKAHVSEERQHGPLSHLGLYLDPARVFVSGWDEVPETGAWDAEVARLDDWNPAPLPPAVLVPRVDGEPVRADLVWPPHPRGVGQPWPPEARVTEDELPGRFPLAYAWSMLSEGKPWTWPDGAEQVQPSHAIATVVTHVVNQICGEEHQNRHAIVVPNTLPLMSQQKLIDDCRKLGVEVKLLWRPVAAAMKWCELNPRTSPISSSGDTALPKILVLHLGIEDCETTWLEVMQQRHDDRIVQIPARRRPQAQSTAAYGIGLPLLHRWAVEHGRNNCGDRGVDAAKLWNTLWASKWLGKVLPQAYENPNGSPLLARSSETDAKSAGALLRDMSRGEMAIGNGWLAPSAPSSDFSTWWESSRQLISDMQFAGAVATGPLAAIRLADGATLGAAAIAELCGLTGDVLVEGVDIHRGFMADAGATYLARLAAGVPAYMDSLPNLRTAAYVKGEPQWVSLLTDEFCPGGQMWARPERVSGLEIRENLEQLEVVVDHEDYRTVRSAVAPLPDRMQVAVPVELDISIEPAAGNAQIRVVPVEAEALGRRRVFIEWERMTEVRRDGKGLSAEEWLKKQPTLFPDTLPRKSSRYMWVDAAGYAFQRCISRLPNPATYEPDLKERLGELAKALRGKDPYLVIEGSFEKKATALNSNGEPPIASDLPERFANIAFDRIKHANEDLRKQLVRALAATSTPNPKFQDYLAKRIYDLRGYLDRYDLSAIGWCLRDPKSIYEFARVMAARFRDDQSSPNNWIKALGEVLRYRADATSQVASGECHELTRTLLKILRASRSRRMIYKNAALCAIYLLRRRRYDDGYLKPDSDLAKSLKEEFNTVIDLIENKKLSGGGGAIPLPELLELAIKFIDRKGPDILSASEVLREAADE